MSEGYVKSNYNQGITTIEFFHPAHNSLPSDLLTELVHQIDAAGQVSDCKLILLQAAGDKTFCAGASFTELSSISDENQATKFFMGFANVINAIRKSPKIVVCRVHGKAVGGGVGIAAACDYALACIHATIKLSELSVGFGPFVIGPAVERKIGLSAFSQLSLNASEWQTAEWAKQKGLYMESFDTLEQLDAYVAHFAQELSKKSGHALAQLKKIFWENASEWDDLLQKRAAISGQLLMTEEAKTAIATFLKA